MSTPQLSPTPGPARFATLDQLRAAHAVLLAQREAQAGSPAFLDAVAAFIECAARTGQLLYDTADRRTAQSLLTYWSNLLYRAGREPPGALLALFDERLAPTLDDALCPYIGLEPFDERQKDRFFGRQALVAELAQRLGQRRFVAVVGASGSGKSSLVRAGLLPALRAGALPGSAGWRYLPPSVPGSSPLASLAHLLCPPRADTNSWEQRRVNDFLRDDGHLAALIGRLRPIPTILVIDQFEELFTLVDDRREIRAFAANLARLAEAPGPRHSVIVTMREEFVARIGEVPQLESLFPAGRVQVTGLLRAELREAIVNPARQVGLVFDAGVVDRLVDDLAGDPAVLPLLQFTLLQLWKHRRRNRIAMEVYHQIGESGKALEQAADAFYEGQALEQNRETIKRILLRLVEVRQLGEITSRRIRRDTLYSLPHDRGRVDRMLAALVGAGLVRLAHGRTPADDQVELAHEALIRNWQRLRDWLEEERDRLRERQRLTSAAEQWKKLNRRDEGALWVSRDLLQTTRGYADLSPLEQEFIAASEAAIAAREEGSRRELEEARQLAEERAQTNRRLRRQQGLLVAAVLLAVFAAAVAIQQYILAERRREQADRARQQVAAQALVLKMQSFRSSRNLFLRAAIWLAEHEQGDTGQAAADDSARLAYQDLLQQAVQLYVPGMPHSGLQAVAWSPDGRQIATTGGDRLVRFWDAADLWQPKPLLALTRAVTSTQLLWSQRDPEQLLAADSDGSARLLSRATGATLAAFQHDTAGRNPIRLLAWSPDERMLLTGGVDRARVADNQPPRDQDTVKLWDARRDQAGAQPAGRPLCTWNSYNEPISALAWSPDATLVLIAAQEKLEVYWANAECQLKQRQTLDGPVRAAAWSPNGDWLLLAVNRQARILRVRDGVLDAQPAALLIGHTDTIGALAWSPDGKSVVSMGADRTVRVWDVAALQSQASDQGAAISIRQISELRGEWEQLIDVAWRPDSQALLVAGAEKRVSDITGETDAQARAYFVDHFDEVLQIAQRQAPPTASQKLLDSEEEALIEAMAQEAQRSAGQVASATGLTPRDTSTNLPIPTATSLPMPPAGTIGPPTHTGSSTQLAMHTQVPAPPTSAPTTATQPAPEPPIATEPAPEPTLLPSATPASPVAAALPGTLLRELRGHADFVLEARFSPDGELLASASKDGTAMVWNLADGTVKYVLRHGARVNSVAFNRDGSLLATTSDDQKGRLWSMRDGHLIAELPHDERANNAEFNPAGDMLVTASRDNTAKVWRASDGALVCTLPHARQVFTALFSPDGSRVVTAVGDGTARIWQVSANGCDTQPAITLSGHGDSVLSARFSADGQYLITASVDTTARIWNAHTGQQLVVLRGHTGWVRKPSFSPDGSLALTASDDGTARIWRVADGSSLAVLRHDGEVSSARFSNDGRYVVTASADRSVRLWDAQKGQLVADMRGHTDPVVSAEFSDDGSMLASASLDGTVRIWRAASP